MSDTRGFRYREDRGDQLSGSSRLIRELQDQAARLQQQAAELAALNDELSSSRARLQGIIDSALDAIITTDSRDRVLGWNPPAERIFGWTAAEAIGRDIGELILTDEERAKHEKGLKRFLTTGEWRILNRRLVMEALHRDRTPIPVEFTIAATATRREVIFTTFIRDISERIREERTRAARVAVTRIIAQDLERQVAVPQIVETLCSLLECEGGAYWTIGEEGERLELDRVWIRPDSKITAASEARTTADERGLAARAWRTGELQWTLDVRAEPTVWRIAERKRHCAAAVPVAVADRTFGVLEMLDLSGNPPREEHLAMLKGVASDIAQFLSRREVEEELARRNEWQRFMSRAAAKLAAAGPNYQETLQLLAELIVPRLADWCSVYTMDVGGELKRVAMMHVQSAEAHAAEGVAMAGARLTRRHPARLVAETGDPVIVTAELDSIVEQAASTEDELRRLRDLHISSGMIVPLIARGRTHGAVLLLSMDPARIYREPELESAMEFASRAAMFLDNARLYRDAQVANESKADFLATVSHELRTPLNAIIGYADLLTQGIPHPVEPPAERYVRRISFSAHHLLQLIEEILTFSRLEAGREQITLERIDMREIAEEVQAIMEPMANEKALELRVDLSAIDRPVRTDPRKIRQILLNLLSNAVKFTSAGTIEVTGELQEQEMVLVVRDTGIGMSEEHLDQIFEPFWQVEQANTRTTHGTGLGLSVTRRFARLLGGTIEVESAPEMGSTFIIRLPADPGAKTGADVI